MPDPKATFSRPALNPDADPAVKAANGQAREWEQVGAHERVARRTARNKGGTADKWYQGPPATKHQREQAYTDLQKKYPHLRTL